MKIAILGWGSLIWDKRPEFDDRHEDWQPDGPSLNLEFCRVSETRLGALTLVLDDEHGQDCRVNYAISKRGELDDVICDLRGREGTIRKRIGYFVTDDSRSGAPDVPNNIKTWLIDRQLDAAVWTGLTSNFLSATQLEFSVPSAIKYFQSLPSEGKAKAAEYIWRAPDSIRTPLRRAMEVEPWFSRA